jgi:hypothetical protein
MGDSFGGYKLAAIKPVRHKWQISHDNGGRLAARIGHQAGTRMGKFSGDKSDCGWRVKAGRKAARRHKTNLGFVS